MTPPPLSHHQAHIQLHFLVQTSQRRAPKFPPSGPWRGHGHLIVMSLRKGVKGLPASSTQHASLVPGSLEVAL